jgi:hypothetical protein
MKVIPYLLGPGIRRFSSALLYDPPLEIDLPAWAHEDAPRAFTAVADAASSSGSPVAPAMAVAEKYLWLQQRHAQALMPEIDALRPHVRLVSSLYPGTRAVFASVRRIYEGNQVNVRTLTNTSSAAAAAAFDFHRRVFEYWIEMDRDPSKVVAVLEEEARSLKHPTELVIESYINRFLNTFGVAQPEGVPTATQGAMVTPPPIHPIVDSVGAAELGAACIIDRGLLQAEPESGQVAGQDPGRAISIAPVAFMLFDRLVCGRVPAIAGVAAAETLAAMVEDHEEALGALRKKCWSVADEITCDATSLTEFNKRLASSLNSLTLEASAVRRQNRETTRKYAESLSEDPVLWGLAISLAGVAGGLIPGVGALPAVIGLFVRLGTAAVKARRERNERVSESDLRFLYYIDPDPEFA